MKISEKIEPFRELVGQFASNHGDPFGRFYMQGPNNTMLLILASDATKEIPWDHVSVSTRNRCPNWVEMCFVKDLFFDLEEVAMQLHPAKSQWVNNHPYCLHLWRPIKETIPLPPRICV